MKEKAQEIWQSKVLELLDKNQQMKNQNRQKSRRWRYLGFYKKQCRKNLRRIIGSYPFSISFR